MEGLNKKENNDVVSGVDSVKKGKGKLIAGIAAGVVVVAGVGGVAAYATSDYVKNQVKLMVSSPENYYTWVNEKNTNDFSAQISEQYRTEIEMMKSGQKSSVSFKYEISDDVKNLLVEDLDEDEQEIIDIIQNVNDISFGVNGDSKDNVVNGNAFFAWNGENLATFDMAFDSSDMSMFFRIPELTEQWINIETDLDYDDIDSNAAMTAYEKFASDPESVITPEELEAEMNKYANLWNECIADVELEKKTDVNIADITVNYTVVSVTIDEAKVNEIAEKFINTAKEDEILKSIVVDRLALATADEYNSGLDDMLDEFKEDNGFSSGDAVEISTYIDPMGCIRGVSMKDVSNINNSAKFIVGKDGDEIRGQFSVMSVDDDDELNQINMILSATESDSKYTGALDMTVDDETVSVEFINLETVDEEKGYMNGVVTLVLPADAEIDPISFTLSSDGTSQTISLPLDFDGTNYGTLSLDVSAENGAETSMPDKSAAFVIDEDTDAELSDYIEQEKMEEFVKNLLLKIGFSDEIAEEAAKAAGEEFYYDYSAYYDYDDFDTDFSYGWDTDEDDIDFYDDDYDWETLEAYNDFSDPYANDQVAAENGQAYICILDSDMEAAYSGYEGDTLSYNAVNADINGNGTYTVKVTADTDGYRNAMGDKKPNGILIFGVEARYLENADNASMEVTSVKIDGKEYEISNAQPNKYEYDYLSAMIYIDELYGEDSDNIIDVDDVGEWTEIEVTFEVSGME